MDASDAIAAIGIAVSGILAVLALVVSHRANVRSKEANRIAADALAQLTSAHELEQRQDDRLRERHDVEWEATWLDEEPGTPARWALHNVGSTAAHDVVALVYRPGQRRLELKFGTIEPGTFAVGTIYPNLSTQLEIEALRLDRLSYTLHWNSPLGVPDSSDHIPPQIF